MTLFSFAVTVFVQKFVKFKLLITTVRFDTVVAVIVEGLPTPNSTYNGSTNNLISTTSDTFSTYSNEDTTTSNSMKSVVAVVVEEIPTMNSTYNRSTDNSISTTSDTFSTYSNENTTTPGIVECTPGPSAWKSTAPCVKTQRYWLAMLMRLTQPPSDITTTFTPEPEVKNEGLCYYYRYIDCLNNTTEKGIPKELEPSCYPTIVSCRDKYCTNRFALRDEYLPFDLDGWHGNMVSIAN